MRNVLEAKGINYLEVDIGDPRHVAEKMMVKSNASTPVTTDTDTSIPSGVPPPPHIFNNGTYRGVRYKSFTPKPYVCNTLSLTLIINTIVSYVSVHRGFLYYELWVKYLT